MSAIDDLPPLREVIAQHRIAARKSLGQNFLLDLNVTSKIARAAGDLSEVDVLEIGPGPGGLTRGLLAQGARRVVAVEKDRRCIPALNDIAIAYPGRLSVLSDDALTLDVAKHLNPPVKIAANLPYNIGTKLLTRWLDPEVWPPFWSQLTLMFQREVAERIVAKPGSKSYGRLSILASWRSDAKIVMELPPEAFTPPPKVRSAVVNLVALPAPRYPADGRILFGLVARAFNQRRKMLRASLKAVSPDIEDILVEVGIMPTDRAETIDLEKYCALARLIARRKA
ncbi:MAG: 16S rRNA (adenine(1518)-N(6)/adenine(1519)-N(6))-dimethyltransferase RsmA [Boseongicola sp.]